MQESNKLPPALTVAIVAAFAVIAAAVGYVVSHEGVNRLLLSNQVVTIEQVLSMSARETNKVCPKTVDSETRLDDTSAGPGKTFHYRYTLVNLSKADMRSEEFAPTIRPEIVNLYKTNPIMKSFRDNGVIVHHRYSDKDGVLIADVAVGPADLK